MTTFRFTGFIAPIFAFILVGCSGGSEIPSSPSPNNQNQNSTAPGNDTRDHIPWGFWTITIDEDAQSIVIIPDRNTEIHFNVVGALLPPKCTDCLTVTVNSYSPTTKILDVDVTLKNPTLLDGRDVRGILYTDDLGRVLLYPDDWTGLWDITGGEEINPFRAFAKETPSRIFAAGESHTENFIINMTHWGPVHFAVDASWPENCEEPFEISEFTQDYFPSNPGYSATLSVVVQDWMDDTDEVTISVPGIAGVDPVAFTHGINDTWTVEITNVMDAQTGDYEGIISASSELDGLLALFDEVTVKLGEPHTDLDIQTLTPQSLNFTPYSLAMNEGYLYTWGDINGIHVWDLADPSSPEWAGKLPFKGDYGIFKIENGIAYISNGGMLDIYEVTSPGNFTYLDSIGPFIANYIGFKDGYLCFVTGGALEVWDIDPYNEAHLAATVDLQFDSYAIARNVTVGEGMAYIQIGNAVYDTGGLKIVSIDPPESAHLVETISFTGDTHNVAIGNGVAVLTYSIYVGYYSSFPQIGIYDSQTGTTLKTISAAQYVTNVEIIDGYAYVHGASLNPEEGDVGVIDLSDPPNAEIIYNLDCGHFLDMVRNGNYLYAAVWDEGLRVIDYLPPGEATLVNVRPSPRPNELAAGDGIVIAGNETIAAFADVSTPSAARFAGQVNSNYDEFFMGFAVDGNFAYLTTRKTGGSGYLYIVDVTNPDQPGVVNVVTTLDVNNAIDVANGYACIVGNNQFEILDIDPPETAFTAGSGELDDSGVDVVIQNSYAYVAVSGSELGGLSIIDFSVPETPIIVKKIVNEPDDPTYVTQCVDVYGNYAYTGVYYGAYKIIKIIDISNPPEAFVTATLLPNFRPEHLSYGNGYLVIESALYLGPNGLFFVDVTTPEEPIYDGFFEVEHDISDLEVDGSYAYTIGMSGLDIFKLW